MKKITALVLALLMFCTTVVLFSGCGERYDVILNVYNWGEYMSIGADGSLDVNKAFEKWYFETYNVKVKVNYDTYPSNEDLRGRLETGGVSYDVIIPSDYMIEYFISKDMLVKLNYDNIPLFDENIDDDFKNLYYDPKNEYTVPYAYGMVGVIYNANVVSEADATGWDLLWNEKYSGQIVQYNNSRDAFGTAMYKLGIDVNTMNKDDWDRAAAELKKQSPLVKSLVMDEIFNMMQSGEAAIGSYYAGDYFTMLDNQADDVDLRFYYPENTNLYVDAMCIPTCCKNQEVAERYINFMLSEEAAIANAEMTYYASPNKLVYNSQKYKDDLGDAYSVLYPSEFKFSEKYQKGAYRALSPEILAYMTNLWEDVKIK